MVKHVFPALIFKIRMPKTRGVMIIQVITELMIRNLYTDRLAFYFYFYFILCALETTCVLTSILYAEY